MRLLEILGSNTRQYRRARGLTQAQLAERVSISVEMVGKIERGVSAPSLETIEKLSRALDVQPAALFGAKTSATAPDSRSAILQRIDRHLANLNEADLTKVEGILAALAR